MDRYTEDEMMAWCRRTRPLMKGACGAVTDVVDVLSDYLGDDVLYCPETQEFYLVGEDGIWDPDPKPWDRMYRILADLEKCLLGYFTEEYVDQDCEDEYKWAGYCRNIVRAQTGPSQMHHVIRLLGTRVTAPLETFDASKRYVGMASGVWDMEGCCWLDSSSKRDGVERDPRKLRITKRCDGDAHDRGDRMDAFEPDRRWAEFVHEVMCGDKERSRYLQKALGYSCFAGNPLECMFVAYGPSTRNGKSTLFNSVCQALGDYSCTMDPSFLYKGGSKDYSAPNPALVRTVGKRLLVLGETDDKGPSLDAARIKMLTGEDPVVTRQLHQAAFEFVPQFTMWLHCNHLPEISDPTLFDSGRIRVVPFERHFDPEEQDPTLKRRFATERGRKTILTWLFEGYALYLREGLNAPESNLRATASYLSDSDPIKSFIEECCEVGAECKGCVTDMYRRFTAWHAKQGYEDGVGSAAAFRRRLEGLGYEPYKRDGRNWLRGLQLKETKK